MQRPLWNTGESNAPVIPHFIAMWWSFTPKKCFWNENRALLRYWTLWGIIFLQSNPCSEEHYETTAGPPSCILNASQLDVYLNHLLCVTQAPRSPPVGDEIMRSWATRRIDRSIKKPFLVKEMRVQIGAVVPGAASEPWRPFRGCVSLRG